MQLGKWTATAALTVSALATIGAGVSHADTTPEATGIALTPVAAQDVDLMGGVDRTRVDLNNPTVQNDALIGALLGFLGSGVGVSSGAALGAAIGIVTVDPGLPQSFS
ncbi:hypothetical protein [Nocardia stercoris]|uniref:Secreted protein n=1 Tax=Nocardia stercoris TaxID=2483361 RepID=A0A3M2LEB0_9NOCA|nr:hypothetical protein [Nocardia stercoris]RMI34923.1 hypothetical protein EBN03_00715 [Nocardia stercoris]